MEQTVAERPLSQDQHINHRQTCNSGSMGSDSHIRENPSENWDPRRRAGWSSFQSDQRKQGVCRDFLRGKCARGASCKFEHSESDGQEGYKLYGENLYHDSRTSSFPRELRSSSPSREFRNGESCSYLHSYRGFHRSRNDYSTPLQHGVATTSRYHGNGEGHRGNTLWTSQENEEAKVGKSVSTRLSSREYRSRSPCRTFLRGRRYSGAACPYYHPDKYVRSRNDVTPPWHQESVVTSRNPNFGRGRVDMTSWSSNEQGKRNEGIGQSTGSFYAGKRSRSPCRNFIRGRCYRGAQCPYLHTNAGLRDDCITQRPQQVAVTSEHPGFAEGSVHITSMAEPKVGSDQMTRSSSAGYRSKSPCRDFLKGRCSRGAQCPYLHLDSDAYVRPKDVCSTQQIHEVAATSENSGFGEGREALILKTSQEHDEANMDEDLRRGYFPRGPRSRSPCRKFLSGSCYRGASCRYLHLETHDRSRDIAAYEKNRNRDNVGITSRSWSPDRQRSRPLAGVDKPRPQVCLKYCRGRCTLGESCRYLHSFHEYAKSASDCKKQPHFESAGAPRNSGIMHQCDPSMVREELDGSFDEITRDKYAENAEKTNITDAKDAVAVGDQQKCEVSGEPIAKNCNFSEADEKSNLCHQSVKRRRSSRSPSSPKDNIDGRKLGRDESQDNFHKRRRSGSPLTPRDDSGCKKIRRDESYNNFPRGRFHNVAPFRYSNPYSYRYNGPRYYMNKEPQLSLHNISEDPNVTETQRRDEVGSHEMQLDHCPNIGLDSSTQIVNVKNGAEYVKGAVQPSLVDQAGGELVRGCKEHVILKGENAVNSVVASDTKCSCGENRSSPMDTITGCSNKDDNAEVNTALSQEGNEKTGGKKQALKTSFNKMDRTGCCEYCKEPLRDVIDLSTCGLPSSSTAEASLSQPNTSSAGVSNSTQDEVNIGLPVQQLEQGNEVTTKEVQNNVSVQGTTNDGSSVVCNSKSNSTQTLQSSLMSGVRPKRNLLVLDVNGLLADIVNVGEVPRGYKPDTIIAMKAVFKRPFCDEFLEFCFDRFDVGVWSSRNKKNVDRVLDFLMFNTKKRLLFCWDQAHCTETGYKTIENRDKPLVLKELKKLWEKQETDLPWEKGFYDATNTVLLDDSPYKALRNPPYTAIFPYAYKFRDTRDRSLGRGGDLRVYLEKLATTDDIQKFIQENPFGQRPITKSNLSWGFYSKIVGSLANQQEVSSSNVVAMKVVTSHVSQQEGDSGNNSHATKSEGDNKEQKEGTSAVENPGAHLDREDVNADNNTSHETRVEGNSDLKIMANGNRPEGNADTKVMAPENLDEGNVHTTDATHMNEEP